MNVRMATGSIVICLFFGVVMTATTEAQYFPPSLSPFVGGSYLYLDQYYSSPYLYYYSFPNGMPGPMIGTYLPNQPRPSLPYERYFFPGVVPQPYPYCCQPPWYGPQPYVRPYSYYYYYPLIPTRPYLYRYRRPHGYPRAAPWPNRRYGRASELRRKFVPLGDESSPDAADSKTP